VKKKQYKGIWFYGLSGTGKTFSSKFIKKIIKKNSIVLDGDDVRKYISLDLGYAEKDRKIQIKRILGISKIAIKSKIFPIASSVYMDSVTLKKIKKIKIIPIEIIRKMNKIKSLRKIYSNKKNVVGVDIKLLKFKTLKIKNEGNKKFCDKLWKLAKKINFY
jgi:hypothetical protein